MGSLAESPNSMEIETGFDLGTHTQRSNGTPSSRGLTPDATASAVTFALPDVIVALPPGVGGVAVAGAGGTDAVAGFGRSGAGVGCARHLGKPNRRLRSEGDY